MPFMFLRSRQIHWVSAFLATIISAALSSTPGLAAEVQRPNILWIMSEDNSKHYLRHFDRHGAVAPNIEALAQHGVTFDRAFSCAPVCSVARTTLITSCYAPRIGTQFHRRSKMATMSNGVKMFPAYLRAAGYYTTNNSKEDYNAQKSGDVWNESSRNASWKNRPNDATPFFHVLTSTLSHESSLHFDATAMEQPTVTEPASVQLQPYFPDTKIFRYTRARYHDRIMAIDQVVGKVVAELQKAGELENTFIFYFGDHGGVLPRSKGYAYESGLHVPLVVRVPDNYKDLVGRELSSRTKGFVEFVDFGPTVLSLAGVDRPNGIDGDAFLGKDIDVAEVDARNEAFGYADRFDEKYDLVRTLRQGNFKYIRNFEPFLPDGLQNNYRYKMLAFEQWRQLHEAGELNEIQSQFFQEKPVEALYDLDSDPHEVHNLAADPQYAEQRNSMRQRLTDRLKSMPDLSFVPEAVLFSEAMPNPVAFGQANKTAIAGLIDTVNLALLPFDEAESKLKDALQSDDPWTRYWAVVACSSFGKAASSLAPLVEKRLVDLEPLVVMRAVEFVAITSEQDPRPSLYRSFQRATNEPEALRMLNTAVFLNDFCDGRLPVDVEQIDFLFKPKPRSELIRRLDYLAR
jgi:arylsulfatase A-like enzyme